jgi:hypothetical protein
MGQRFRSNAFESRTLVARSPSEDPRRLDLDVQAGTGRRSAGTATCLEGAETLSMRGQLKERGSVMLSRERCSASTPNASSTAAAINIRMAAIAYPAATAAMEPVPMR